MKVRLATATATVVALAALALPGHSFGLALAIQCSAFAIASTRVPRAEDRLLSWLATGVTLVSMARFMALDVVHSLHALVR